jgi:PAS domain S-box-containing protein
MTSPAHSGKKFSTYLSWTLIILSTVSLIVVMGVLYIILSRTMESEFYNRLEAEQTKVSMSLKDRFNEIKTTLREVSSDNALRVGLMLGMENQLIEILESKHSSSGGVMFFVRPEEGALGITPELPENLNFLAEHIHSLPQKDHLHSLTFKHVGNKRFLTFHSLPIKRRNKRLGTAYAIHDLSADRQFWKRLAPNYDFRLCIWNQGRPVDLKRKKHVGLPDFISPPLPIEKAGPELNKITDKSILTLKDFPRLVYVTSSAPLHERNTSLILLLGGLFAVILFLTFWVSLVIARKVSSPLADMAEQAQAIAREPSNNFLDEKNIRYKEFRKLARAFNHVLASLLQAQNELQNQAQEKIRASEKRYQRVVETSPAGIFSLDEQGGILFANPTLEDMTGYRAEELSGMDYRSLIPPEERRDRFPGLKALCRQAKDGDLGGRDKDTPLLRAREFCWVRRDGRRIWVELRAATVMEEGRETVLVNAMDVTERKKAEQALRQSEQKYRSVINQSRDCIYLLDPEDKKVIEANPAMQELLGYSREEIMRLRARDFVLEESGGDIEKNIHRVLASGELFIEERTLLKKDGERVEVELSCNMITYNGKQLINVLGRDLSERKKIEEERLKRQKLESVGVLAGGLAHDFNNLLTGIIGNISLAGQRAGANKDILEPLKKANDACCSAQGIAQQLLTFSKGGVPVKDTVSPAGLLRDSTTFSLRGSNVDCRFSLPENLWDIQADRTQISQVINNLVLNAQEAMPNGGSIHFRAENEILEPKSDSPLPGGRYVHIEIADQGTGISKDTVLKIFDPYFTTKETGNGLGLAMVYSIIKKHGGHISVDSAPGEGTTFHIHLPAADKTAPGKNMQKNGTVPADGQKILVMDDEEVVLDVAGEALKHLGYKAVTAGGGQEALEIYKQALQSAEPFDAVILDLTVRGGMGGEETLRRLREIDPDVRAVVSSGYSQDPIMAYYREHGFSGVLGKPYRIDKLAEVLHEVLDNT